MPNELSCSGFVSWLKILPTAESTHNVEASTLFSYHARSLPLIRSTHERRGMRLPIYRQSLPEMRFDRNLRVAHLRIAPEQKIDQLLRILFHAGRV